MRGKNVLSNGLGEDCIKGKKGKKKIQACGQEKGGGEMNQVKPLRLRGAWRSLRRGGPRWSFTTRGGSGDGCGGGGRVWNS